MRRWTAAALMLLLGWQAGGTPAQAVANDRSLLPLMAAWQQALAQEQPDVAGALRWPRGGDVAAIGALMFELADVAPLSRAPLPAELAPYAHQFAGDMMKSPVLVRVAMRGEQPMYLAFNKRPDTPPSAAVRTWVGFALGPAGQRLVAQQPGLRPLTGAELSRELSKVDGYVAPLDPALPIYVAGAPVQGEISSVGSDGMKSLMERWMNDFRALQPGVRRGQRWEHLGTLNGFHALMANETDLAPMGRELWPDEAAAYASQQGCQQPLEIRVARGGFNTPQRTTAQAVFVNAGNPLQSITLPQLAAVLGAAPTITRWGQLGLTGDWANRPITVAMPPRITPNAMSMQMMVLKGRAWNAAAREASVADTAKAIAADPATIGFGGLEDGAPGLKALAVAPGEGSPPVQLNGETAANGRYPLTRYMYIRLQPQPGQALPPPVREFLRFILSRQGQEPVVYSGYFPLTAAEVAAELAKLE
ncbi:PstS family phosphate ABC transporter substrate-binding protein [Roseateles sp. BYS78W]|uniref:PstS family phosphate ABC transporter substrate-binding protein n=1 Tax=Pelomonas candidula TaxID=3299025 RepID=A0ABW7HJA4_9BURK